MTFRGIIATFVLILSGLNLFAGPAGKRPIYLSQPDGTTFQAVITGDEFTRIKTTASGQAVIQDSDGWWCYAAYGNDGSKVSSGWKVGSDTPADILAAATRIPYQALALKARESRLRMAEHAEEPKEEATEETTEQIVEEIVEEPIIEEPIIKQEESPENKPEDALPVKEPLPAEETLAIPEEKVIATETSSKEQDKPTEEKKTSAVLWGIIVFLVLVILFGAYWLFFKPETTTQAIPSAPVQQETITAVQASPEASQPSKEPSAQPKQEEVTTPATEPKVTTIEPMATPTKNERVPSMADTLEYKITGTKSLYTLQNGETIIRASVKFFGSKKYWPYIVIHNRDVIKNADNVPVGTQIKIPELTPKN